MLEKKRIQNINGTSYFIKKIKIKEEDLQNLARCIHPQLLKVNGKSSLEIVSP